MEPTTALIITLIAIIFSGLFSGTEIAFLQSSKVRIQIDATKGGPINRIINMFNKNQDMFISTLLVGNNVVLVVYGITISVLINPLLESWLQNDALVLISNAVISTGIILLLGEFLPKTIFRINPDVMLRTYAIPVSIIYIILYPVSLFVSRISGILMKLIGIKETKQTNELLTMDQLDDYIQQSIDESDNKTEVDNEVKIFRNAIDFKDTHIGECMTPRNEIVAVDMNNTSRDKLVKIFSSTGFSKILVYNEDIDDITGYIHISELLDAEARWQDHIKPVIYTPETMLANKMMRRLLSEKKSMAIVVDEFGGTSGLVTLEDLVEEIFGEIEDEHDRKQLISRKVNDEEYEFSGRIEIEHANEDFNLDLKESEEYHTIAGYILENLEALPQQGDKFVIGKYNFTILKMSGPRIDLIRINPI